MEKDLNYYKECALEEYEITPISSKKYIAKLEQELAKVKEELVKHTDEYDTFISDWWVKQGNFNKELYEDFKEAKKARANG